MRLFLGGITGREVLYKALRQDSAPRFDTTNRVVNALGLKLTVQQAQNFKKYSEFNLLLFNFSIDKIK